MTIDPLNMITVESDSGNAWTMMFSELWLHSWLQHKLRLSFLSATLPPQGSLMLGPLKTDSFAVQSKRARVISKSLKLTYSRLDSLWLVLLTVHTPPFKVISCPDPPHTCKKEGLVFWATFLVKWGGVALQCESSNQIAECVIICDDVAIKHKIKLYEPRTNFTSSLFVVFSAVAR